MAKKTPAGTAAARAREAIAALRRMSTARDRENLKRFAIATPKPIGVSMAKMKVLARRLGRDHELALALWRSGWYEARMLATLVDDPAQVSPKQMDRWCRDFDNWAICDTACFCLFDRTPYAFAKVAQWRNARDEFVKRAAFALLASLALHDKTSSDAAFRKCLRFIPAAAADERNFVKKGVSWALRAVGRRRKGLRAEAVALARRLAGSKQAPARWIGQDALRDLLR